MKHSLVFFYVMLTTSFDNPVSTRNRVRRLRRVLLEYFCPIALITESGNLTFEHVIASIEKEISRRKKKITGKAARLVAVSASMFW